MQFEVYLDLDGNECDKGKHSFVKLVGDYISPKEKVYPKTDQRETKRTYIRKYMRDHPEYWYKHWWSCKIKSRDKKCVYCNSTNNLNAHHILYRRFYPEMKTILNNGITLCIDCHKILHKINN